MIGESLVQKVAEMLGSREVADAIEESYHNSMINFLEEEYDEMSDEIYNLGFFIYYMGFATGLENAENVNKKLVSTLREKTKLQ
jgi:predicted house-cleaning noncanonical NTP pyrophosphatase (MazG superfamily)